MQESLDMSLLAKAIFDRDNKQRLKTGPDSDGSFGGRQGSSTGDLVFEIIPYAKLQASSQQCCLGRFSPGYFLPDSNEPLRV